MICRICLKAAEFPLAIFNEDGEELNVALLINQHLWFQPLPNDAISTVICSKCWSKLKEFHEFYLAAKEAHNHLAQQQQHVKGDTSIATEDEEQEQEISSIEIKEEWVEQEVWPENIERQLTDEEEDEQKDEEEFDVKNPLYVPEAQEEQESSQVSNSKVGKRKKRKRTLDKSIVKAEEDANVDAKPEKRKRKERQKFSEHDDEIVKKHIAMGCDLCPFVGKDFTEMTEHFRKQHIEKKPYVMCCNRKLNKRFLLVQHALKHENPEFFKCTECGKVFADGYILRSHMLACHSTEEDLVYACDVCPKKFSRRYLLDLHKPSHIPVHERKFMCPKCPQSKPFASEHLLSIHTSMRHTRLANVCHVCAKEIRDNQAFEKHVRLHFEASGPRIKCPRPDCDSWLKDEDNLKCHLRRHNDEGKIFTCDQCGRVCKNRRSLNSHLRYAHTTEVFACEECNKTFKKAITLREHMASHTGEALYKCPFCERTFNSNANMHSHKKRMHPVEWDYWRKTKTGSSQRIISETW